MNFSYTFGMIVLVIRCFRLYRTCVQKCRNIYYIPTHAGMKSSYTIRNLAIFLHVCSRNIAIFLHVQGTSLPIHMQEDSCTCRNIATVPTLLYTCTKQSSTFIKSYIYESGALFRICLQTCRNSYYIPNRVGRLPAQARNVVGNMVTIYIQCNVASRIRLARLHRQVHAGPITSKPASFQLDYFMISDFANGGASAIHIVIIKCVHKREEIFHLIV